MANDPFKALAHPIRRGVIERLAQGPATVREATSAFDVSKPTLSKHLRVLEEAGLITRVIDGREHRLALAVEPLREAGTWIDEQRGRWEGLFDAVESYLENRA
ncbi:MAG: winged helix-turn-helix transcriptional regulator [Solirubrobacterales bacterium]|nr:winged helix-turn-helix transcriptional regulator [Solirubrobacterales bacterium]